MRNLCNTTHEIEIDTSCQGRQVTQVLISHRKAAACLCGKSIVLTHLPFVFTLPIICAADTDSETHSSNEIETLHLADTDTINQAAFGVNGQWLCVWATGASSDSCYFWDVSAPKATLYGKGLYRKVCSPMLIFCAGAILTSI